MNDAAISRFLSAPPEVILFPARVISVKQPDAL